MGERIRTARLVLEPVTPAMAAAILAGDVSGLRPGQGWPHQDTLAGLHIGLEFAEHLGWFLQFDGVVVGECGTHGPADESGTVEIGYGLAGPYRGRGLATEACTAMADWLLARPGIERVLASTNPGANPASRRVLEKSGFVLDHLDGPVGWYAREAEALPSRS